MKATLKILKQGDKDKTTKEIQIQIKRQRLSNRIQKQDPILCCPKAHLKYKIFKQVKNKWVEKCRSHKQN